MWIFIVLLRRFDGAGKDIVIVIERREGRCDGFHVGLDSWW